eukprot:scaffold279393_cov35-Tisochrysis_lutea.AAC.2
MPAPVQDQARCRLSLAFNSIARRQLPPVSSTHSILALLNRCPCISSGGHLAIGVLLSRASHEEA